MGRTSAGVPIRWAVLDDEDRLLPDIAQYTAYLERLERPPNSIRAVAYDLRDFAEYMAEKGLELDDVSNEQLASFMRWHRFGADNVTGLVEEAARRSRSTTNRAMASIAGFYKFLGSRGSTAPGFVGLTRLRSSKMTYRPPRRSVVDSVGAASRNRTRDQLGPRLPRTKKPLKTLTIQQVHQILRECRDHRDRLLVMFAYSTGMRIGQILCLQHEDIDTRTGTVHVVAREDNPNGLRSKRNKSGSIPISPQLCDLYVEYLHEQYGYIDSPYVFIDFDSLDQSTYSSAKAVMERLRRSSGIEGWSWQTLRHTFVTLSRRAGVPIDIIADLVFHSSVATTIETYSHLDPDDLRRLLIQYGVWEEIAA